jgi:hypothetical protein
MKALFNRATSHTIDVANKPNHVALTTTVSCMIVLFTMIFVSACKKEDKLAAESQPQNISSKASEDVSALNHYSGLEPQTLSELQQVRAATAKFQNIDNAFGDNYVDIGLVLPNMGYHILKAELVSPVFDFRKPPILVYNKKANNKFELVAVEYAIPIDPQSPHTPPEGFTGDADVWDFNTLNTGWWTLHAWVWTNNPDGVFKPMNPLVVVR